jgi:membrane associated rhomboid family serine protease
VQDFEAEFERILPRSERRQFEWSRQHRNDAIVLELHPQVSEWLAYTPGKPTAWGLFTAMFLHANLSHIAGNMLFLWVFGRAVEDSLGRGLFLGAYFVCGFAATLLYHIMTRAFSPAGMLIPSLGASGRHRGRAGAVRAALLQPRRCASFTPATGGIPIFYVGLPILGVFLGIALAGGFGLGSSGFTLATIILLACFVIAGNETLWGEWKVKAAWLIACWVVFFDVVPLITQSFTEARVGSRSLGAHRRLLCGVLYAFLIGAQKEGKTEYLVDETRQSLDNKHAANALESAQQVVMMKPDDPVGYQCLQKRTIARTTADEALKNYQIAVDKYLRRGERSAAAKLYLEAQKKHGDWILDAPTLFILASQMARMATGKTQPKT